VARFEALDRFAGLLDWQNLGKSCFVASTGLALALLFAAWLVITFFLTDFGETHLDPFFAHAVLTLHLSASVFWVGVLALGLYLYWRNRNPDWFSYLVLSAYPALLVPGAWIYGWVTLPAGLILVGSVLVGLVLFELRLARVAVATGAVLFSLLVGLTISGHLPYAPLFAVHPLGGDQVSSYYLVSELILASPFFIVSTLIATMMILRWRQREEMVARLSLTDELTGVANRRAILDILDHELARSQRTGSGLTVAMLDLDHFKEVNDTYGHDAGDVVLREVTHRLRGELRQGDYIGRFGGEEFLLLLVDTTLDSAARALDRCRKAVNASPIQATEDVALQVTASFGHCSVQANQSDDAHTLLVRADEALYSGKAAGRNCVTGWQAA
jgi:diguanylate cyclase (GGDEF)-like protein